MEETMYRELHKEEIVPFEQQHFAALEMLTVVHSAKTSSFSPAELVFWTSKRISSHRLHSVFNSQKQKMKTPGVICLWQVKVWFDLLIKCIAGYNMTDAQVLTC